MSINKYLVGIDTATTGAVAITLNNKIINVLKYPERIYDKGEEKIIDSKIKLLEKQPRTATKIKALKAEKKALKRKATRDYGAIYNFLKLYKDNIDVVVIEEPIRQISGMATSIDAIFANAMTLGVYMAICSILGLRVKLLSPTEWHKYFDYDIKGKSSKEKREIIKEKSIQICRERFINADDFLIKKGCKKPDDNIAEAIILSTLCEEFSDD